MSNLKCAATIAEVLKCEILVNRDDDECGKEAIGFTEAKVPICPDCADDDALQIWTLADPMPAQFLSIAIGVGKMSSECRHMFAGLTVCSHCKLFAATGVLGLCNNCMVASHDGVPIEQALSGPLRVIKSEIDQRTAGLMTVEGPTPEDLDDFERSKHPPHASFKCMPNALGLPDTATGSTLEAYEQAAGVKLPQCHQCQGFAAIAFDLCRGCARESGYTNEEIDREIHERERYRVAGFGTPLIMGYDPKKVEARFQGDVIPKIPGLLITSSVESGQDGAKVAAEIDRQLRAREGDRIINEMNEIADRQLRLPLPEPERGPIDLIRERGATWLRRSNKWHQKLDQAHAWTWRGVALPPLIGAVAALAVVLDALHVVKVPIAAAWPAFATVLVGLIGVRAWEARNTLDAKRAADAWVCADRMYTHYEGMIARLEGLEPVISDRGPDWHEVHREEIAKALAESQKLEAVARFGVPEALADALREVTE